MKIKLLFSISIMWPLAISILGFGEVGARTLTEKETTTAIAALVAATNDQLSSDPSCASATEQAPLSVSYGLVRILTMAATTRAKVSIRAECINRPGWPKSANQEYCTVSVLAEERFGLTFLLDWKTGKIATGSVECSY